MSTIGRFVKSTLVGGILFVVPLVVIALLVREGVHMTAQVFRPIARLFPNRADCGVGCRRCRGDCRASGALFRAGIVRGNLARSRGARSVGAFRATPCARLHIFQKHCLWGGW